MVLNLYCIIYNAYELGNIVLILYIVIPENATKLFTKNLKGSESCEDEAWHKSCPNLLEYMSYHMWRRASLASYS